MAFLHTKRNGQGIRSRCGRKMCIRDRVQWKKDVEYSCEYRFPCDYMVTPQLSQKLPKAHENRWIRKLTGENQSMLQIDSVEVATDTIEIEGWYVVREHDNALLTRWLWLKHEMCIRDRAYTVR